MNNAQLICPSCHQPVLAEYYFCPNCGYNLREKEKPVSIMMQVGLYALAVFLPPLGFVPGAKYVMRKFPQARRVGWITILLTTISTILTIWAIFFFLNKYLGEIGSLGLS
jgi:hypothetical protein